MASDADLRDSNVWDDTALIDSWDEAVAEYKKYYSIQAQGKRLEDSLTAEEYQELKEEHGDLIAARENNSGATATNGEVGQMHADGENEDETRQRGAPVEEPATSVQQTESGEAVPHSIPQAMLGTVHDENLRNAMMSWYYAGYYTGLYEGQQKQNKLQQQQKDKEST